MQSDRDRPLADALSVLIDNDSRYRRVEQLAALLDELDVGLVSVDLGTNFATVNGAAATLLKISPGSTTAVEFMSVIRDLAAGALNQDEAEAQLRAAEQEPSTQFRTTWAFAGPPQHLGVVCQPAPYAGFNGRVWAFYDNTALAEAIEARQRADTLLRSTTEGMLDPQVVLEAVWQDGEIVDFLYRAVNTATCEYLRMDRDQLIGHSVLRSLSAIERSDLLAHYARCATTGEPVILDDFPIRYQINDKLYYFDVRGTRVESGWITLTWRDVTERTELTHRIAASEEQFRLLAENVADVVTRLDDAGTITWISKSVEKALGAPPDYWIGKRALDYGLPERRAAAAARWAEIIAGGTTIGRARLLDAHGQPHTIHLHSKPYFDAAGQRDGVVVSFRLIDDEVAAEERARQLIAQRDRQNQALTRLLQGQTDRLMSDINSAAKYVASILPGDLDGPVPTSSRYVSSRELGGDSYDYRWIDDDHLIVYLLDVSGHGVEPAMVSVSVHNLMRSGSFSPAALREPAEVLAELNRLFQMEQHGGNYFTIWYGVYQRSTRTLRFASAGHPPALLFTGQDGGVTVTELATAAMPVGLFEDTVFESGSYVVPPDARLLVYSDGAFELTGVDGSLWSLTDFVRLCLDMAGVDGWSLDALISRLQAVSEYGMFEDDCTLVRLDFPDPA